VQPGPPAVIGDPNPGINSRNPDHLINDTRISTASADRISSSSSWTSRGSLGDSVKRLLSTIEVRGREVMES